MNIAQEAQNLVLGDRNASYGEPVADYTRTAAIWTGLLNEKLKPGEVITPREAILFMAAMKIAREFHKPKRDSRVDTIGYMLCAESAATGQSVAEMRAELQANEAIAATVDGVIEK